jgi:hypothetical protein
MKILLAYGGMPHSRHGLREDRRTCCLVGGHASCQLLLIKCAMSRRALAPASYPPVDRAQHFPLH